MAIKVGSAKIDERGKISGGQAGDQTGREVCTQDYYIHSKEWYLFRPKTVALANKLANAMLNACNNDNIGYDQGERYGVVNMVRKYGSMARIAEKTEADCSSLVRACCIECGFDPGDFNTASEPNVLSMTGKFEPKISVTASTTVYNGDVLVTKTKGHTVIVVSGNPRVDKTEIEYVVQKGDTLSKIAARYNTTYQKLAAYNGISNPSNIDIGQIIRIPVSSSSPASTPTVTPSNPTPTTPNTNSDRLKIESNVRAVQTWLNTYYNTGLAVDGSFGSKSKAALVKAWQTEVGGLDVDGSFGPKSQAAASKNNIKRGSKGILVTIWQAYLVCTGYNPNGIDGSFGLGCRNATVSFQRNKGLTQDGTVGKGTWTAAFRR